MNYRQLGSSALQVSEIALGSWLTYGNSVDPDVALACIRRALDVGINFFDTANVYGRGAAETFLGEALAGVSREKYILATKVFGSMSDTDRGLSRTQIFKQLDASLRRLRVDYVDLYQCGRFDIDTPLEETLQALTEVVRQGKVRYLGFSEWPPHCLAQAYEIADVERFVASQPEYSLLWRRPEKTVMPFARTHGISQLAWSPLAQGVLTGKYKPDSPPPKHSRGANEAMHAFMRNWLRPEVLEAVKELKPLAKKAGVTLAQFSLAWVLKDPNVASAIVGASRPEQVEENARASGVVVDPALFVKADAIVRPLLFSDRRKG